MSSFFTLLVPLTVGVVIAVVAWLMVGRRPDEGSTVTEKACSNCGSLVLDGWRLCPECGEFIDGTSGGDGFPPTGAPGANPDGPF